MGERRDKAIKELRDQLALKQQLAAKSNEKENFWESSNFKILVSMSMLVLVSFRGGNVFLLKVYVLECKGIVL